MLKAQTEPENVFVHSQKGRVVEETCVAPFSLALLFPHQNCKYPAAFLIEPGSGENQTAVLGAELCWNPGRLWVRSMWQIWFTEQLQKTTALQAQRPRFLQHAPNPDLILDSNQLRCTWSVDLAGIKCCPLPCVSGQKNYLIKININSHVRLRFS